MLTARSISQVHPELLKFVCGDLEASATVCGVPEEAGADSLVFAGKPEHLTEASARGAAIVIVHERLAPLAHTMVPALRCVFSTRSIPAAMAGLLRYFDRKAEHFTQWGARHESALVHPSATLGEGVLLGPFCVIGAGSILGEGCMVGAHTVLENDVQVGSGTILHPQVFIGAGTRIGRDCEIHPHTTIGSDGFGYAKDAAGRPRKISQLGAVRIGDGVEIGGNCAIDRATLTQTHIRSGTKLDNLCHIAHNCDLGENGLYTAGFMAAGSARIGRNFATGGNSVVGPHLTVADNVVLAGRSSVSADVTEPGQYGGYPLQPLREALKTLVNIGQLNQMRKRLNGLLRQPDSGDTN